MPKQEIVDKAIEEISKRRVNYEYFFDNLNSPDWIDPLYKKDMFRNPPEPKKKGNLISFPFWPESRYLARMAASSPKIVMTILLEMQTTENIRVHDDFIEAASAACGGAPEITSKWVKKEIAWIKSQTHLPLMEPEKLSQLIKSLCKANSIELAIALASVLLAILSESEEVEGLETGARKSLSEPHSRISVWEYEHTLENIKPILLEYTGVRALKLFCSLLEDAIRHSQSTRNEDEEKMDDYSYIWRPAIEDHSQNHSNNIKDALVTVVRDTAEALIETDGLSVLSIVEGFSFKIFQRIGLYLRRKWIDIDLKGTSTLLANTPIFDDIHLYHELFHLLHDHFNHLLPQARKAYLEFVEKGEDQEKWVGFYKERTGEKPTQKDSERYTRHWQYTKLFPIQESLDPEWQRIFGKLKEEFGPLDHPDFQFYMTGGWAGPVSPKNSEDLRSMSVKEIVAFVGSWTPSGEFMAPSHEGLARELQRVITSSPNRFASEVEQFEIVDPIYISALLSGLEEATQSGTTFTWEPVLQLCYRVVNQATKVNSREDKLGDVKSNRSWLLSDVADLLSAGFQSSTTQIPFDFRTLVWEILKPITDDPDPTPEHESRYGGSNMNPATLSLNTTRGKAMHAVIKYALWVCRNIEESSGRAVSCKRDFGMITEVREVLESHLDPKYDPALSIRAIYGEYIPQFLYIDPNWTSKNIPKIFPSNDALLDLYSAAWESYISFCHPYNNVFDMLREEYARAVQRIKTTSAEQSGLIRPEVSLSEHLMVFYWRGKIGLENETDLITQFFLKAPDSLRAHAIEFIGRILCDMKDIVPVENLDRLKALWSWRLDSARTATPTYEFTMELGGFGWWLISGKFDDSWTIAQFKEALLLGAQIEPAHKIVEHLATLVDSKPTTVVECLELLIEGDEEGWHVYVWRQHIKKIISSALRTTDKNVKRNATELLNRLGARGFLDFRELIKLSDS